MIFASEKTCPKCHSPQMHRWHDLTEDEKLLAKSLPLSAEYTLKKRRDHRFCTRCWFEEAKNNIEEV